MPSELEVLNNLLTNKVKVFCDGKTIALREPEATDSTVSISNIPSDAIFIKCDEFDAPRQVFIGENGECKRCDYILLFSYQENKYALFIEMKRGSLSSRKDVISQLRGGRCFLDYCCSILKHFHEIRKPFGDYQFRYVCLAKTQIDKRPINQQKHKGKSSHTTPEKFKKCLSARRVPLGQLL